MLYAFVESVLGRIDDALAIARGTTARLWRVDTPRGPAIVKQHGHGRAFAQECAALAAVGRVDADGPWPRVIASDDDRRAIVMTWVPGRPGDAPSAAMFRAAGALRRRLDDVPITDDEIALADAMERRMSTTLGEAAKWCDDATIARVRAAWRPTVFVGAKRRFCHRDFAPHNWLVADDGTCVLVDFGHARADHPFVDLARALSPIWGAPALRDELFAGYGRSPTPAELAELAQLELLDALATAAWARRRGDEGLAARADAAVARVLAGTTT